MYRVYTWYGVYVYLHCMDCSCSFSRLPLSDAQMPAAMSDGSSDVRWQRCQQRSLSAGFSQYWVYHVLPFLIFSTSSLGLPSHCQILGWQQRLVPSGRTVNRDHCQPLTWLASHVTESIMMKNICLDVSQSWSRHLTNKAWIVNTPCMEDVRKTH